VALIGVAWLLFPMPQHVRAQTSDDQTGNSVSLGARHGLSPDRPQKVVPEETAQQGFSYTFAAGMASDYIYRGVTLSAHQPVVGSAFVARFGSFLCRVDNHQREIAKRSGCGIVIRGWHSPQPIRLRFRYRRNLLSLSGRDWRN
jgi:hypothetical protein